MGFNAHTHLTLCTLQVFCKPTHAVLDTICACTIDTEVSILLSVIQTMHGGITQRWNALYKVVLLSVCASLQSLQNENNLGVCSLRLQIYYAAEWQNCLSSCKFCSRSNSACKITPAPIAAPLLHHYCSIKVHHRTIFALMLQQCCTTAAPLQ